MAIYTRYREEKNTTRDIIGMIFVMVAVITVSILISRMLTGGYIERQNNINTCLEQYGNTAIQNTPAWCLRYLN